MLCVNLHNDMGKRFDDNIDSKRIAILFIIYLIYLLHFIRVNLSALRLILNDLV